MNEDILNKDNKPSKFVLYLTPEERKELKALSKRLGINDFECLKYVIELVSWFNKV